MAEKTLKKYFLNNSGFSLIEIISVLIIISVIAVVVATAMVDSNADLITQGDLIKSHLRYAQALSIKSDSAIWGLKFFDDRSYYILYRCDGTEADSKCRPNRKTRPIFGAESTSDGNVITHKTDIADGITMLNGFPRLIIAFDSFGRPFIYKNGPIDYPLDTESALVTNPTKLFDITDGNNTLTINMLPMTGYIP